MRACSVWVVREDKARGEPEGSPLAEVELFISLPYIRLRGTGGAVLLVRHVNVALTALVSLTCTAFLAIRHPGGFPCPCRIQRNN